jgi:hypothetical protein
MLGGIKFGSMGDRNLLFCKRLISLTLRKIARFPYENCTVPIHCFRMGVS